MRKARMFPTIFNTMAVKISILALLLCSTGCSVFNLSDYKSFGEWLRGPAGFSKALNGKKEREGIIEDRSLIFLHFRTLEIVFQPAGGLKYPKRITITNSSLLDAMSASLEAQHEAQMYGHGEASYTRVTDLRNGPDDSLAFDWFDAGLLEIIPYRTWASDKSVSYKIGMTLLQPLNTTMTAMMTVVRAPIYATHDMLKTLMIPVAAIYYNSGSKKKPKKKEAEKKTEKKETEKKPEKK